MNGGGKVNPECTPLGGPTHGTWGRVADATQGVARTDPGRSQGLLEMSENGWIQPTFGLRPRLSFSP